MPLALVKKNGLDSNVEAMSANVVKSTDYQAKEDKATLVVCKV
jgi:hypothetical protein